jgi:DNA repair exonuclease SbcCD ATPase subunit
MRRRAAIGMTCLALITTGGCVTRGTYDAVVEERERTKTELADTRVQEESLARQVRELESQNAEAMKEVEITLTAVLKAERDAEAQKKAADDHLAKLKHKINQLTNQQSTLRDQLAYVKEDGAALQEMVSVYQKKVSEQSTASTAPFPPQVAQALELSAPAFAPQPQAEPAPLVELPQQQERTASEVPQPRTVREPEVTETSWLSRVKQWVVSLWQQLFP